MWWRPARDEDVELLPAWLGPEIDVHDPWPTLSGPSGSARPPLLVAEAAPLGLPVAQLGEAPAPAGPDGAQRLDDAPARGSSTMSSWSTCRRCGPDRCASACPRPRRRRVIKVESRSRPDGAARPAGVLRPAPRRARERGAGVHGARWSGEAARRCCCPRRRGHRGIAAGALRQLGADAERVARRPVPRAAGRRTPRRRSGAAGARRRHGGRRWPRSMRSRTRAGASVPDASPTLRAGSRRLPRCSRRRAEAEMAAGLSPALAALVAAAPGSPSTRRRGMSPAHYRRRPGRGL